MILLLIKLLIHQVVNTPIYSKTDSINTILEIFTDSADNLYTIRKHQLNQNDTSPTLFLEKRNAYLSQIVESNILPFNHDFMNVVNAFFDEDGYLYIKAYSPFPVGTHYYILDNNLTVVDSFLANAFNTRYFHKLNDWKVGLQSFNPRDTR